MKDSKINTTDFGDDDVQVVELTKQPIDLYKILKFEGLVASGGEAKLAIAEGYVILNGVVETQKRKKIVSEDVIEFAGILYRMHCDEAIEPAQQNAILEEAAKPVRKSTANTKRKNSMPKKAGRKAIGIKS
tara:strand:- start:15090 stop:15482 length:393 start_codon:yes stop_codon:yes gene_type:complete